MTDEPEVYTDESLQTRPQMHVISRYPDPGFADIEGRVFITDRRFDSDQGRLSAVYTPQFANYHSEGEDRGDSSTVYWPLTKSAKKKTHKVGCRRFTVPLLYVVILRRRFAVTGNSTRGEAKATDLQNAADNSCSLDDCMSTQAQHRTLRCTVPQPFTFEHRDSMRRKPIIATKLEAELALKRQEEHSARTVRSSTVQSSTTASCLPPSPYLNIRTRAKGLG
jgi:hypothetical protein